MKKSNILRLIGITLSMILLFSTCLSFVALADDGKDWADEANRDKAWTDGAISTPQQLAQFAYLINNNEYAGTNKVWLTSDIDLSGKRWIAIGNINEKSKNYAGSFNGNGFTIKNLTYNNNSLDQSLFTGLFGISRAEITAVNVTGEIVIATPEYVKNSFIGGIAGYNFGTISNCNSDVDISISCTVLGGSSVGGIAGVNSGNIAACQNSGDITMNKGNSSPIGGIAAYSTGSIDRCANYGNLSGYTTYVGGISGYIYNESDKISSVTNCYNAGEIKSVDGEVYLYYGGIVAQMSGNSSIVKNCFNVGAIVGNATNGAIVGEHTGTNVPENSYYLDTTCDKGLGKATSGADSCVKQTEAEMKDISFFDKLNVDNAFVFNSGSYPVFVPAKVFISVSVIPKNAKIELKEGDQIFTIDSDTSTYVDVGEYTLIVSAENYVTKTENIIISLNKNTHTISVNLDLLSADYSKVDDALEKIPTDLSVYTDESIDVLNKAKNNVVRGKDISEQGIVDGYAQSIEDAIKGLTLKSGTSSTVTTSASTSKTTLKSSPSTGEQNNIILILSFFTSLFVISFLIFILKRRKISND